MYTIKKSLGQHFLKDERIAKKIVDTLLLNDFKNLLEVGPGRGALTKYLIKIPGIHFKAVELDEEKVNYLIDQFPSLKENLMHQSFLSIERPFGEAFTVIGNFPYNISTQILFKVLEWKEYVPVVIGMFQKKLRKGWQQRKAAKYMVY